MKNRFNLGHVVIALSCIFGTWFSIKVINPDRKPNVPKWPYTNTLTLDIETEVFRTQNYSNFYRMRDLIREVDAKFKQCGASNVAMRLDYYLYTFSKQPDGKVRVTYRPK